MFVVGVFCIIVGSVIISTQTRNVFAKEDVFLDETTSILAPEDLPSASVFVLTEMPLVLTARNFESIAEEGIVDPDEEEYGEITTYTVANGDTLSSLSVKFGVTVNTIRWQNGISSKGTLSVGQKLVILPVDGVTYTVKKGDTLSKIASLYKAEESEIRDFNDLGPDGSVRIGEKIIIPGAEPLPQPKPKPKITKPSIIKKVTEREKKQTGSSSSYRHPLAGRGVKTQGYHGRFRAIDIGAPIGTPVVASMSGTVVISESGGWGGGYGNYIIIAHSNGSQTLYAHNSRNYVSVGDYVSSGATIGLSGNSGRSTGPHLHFEIRNGPSIPCVLFGMPAC